MAVPAVATSVDPTPWETEQQQQQQQLLQQLLWRQSVQLPHQWAVPHGRLSSSSISMRIAENGRAHKGEAVAAAGVWS
jgi:hypothetical protein